MKRRHFIQVSTAAFFGWGMNVSLPAATDGTLDWSCWKGPNHDNQSLDKGTVASWESGGPRLIAQSNGLGEGFSNLCFIQDRIYTLGDFDGITFLVALDRKTGKVVSKTKIGPGGPVGGYVGPKSTPVSDGSFVYALNQNGLLFCFDIKNEELRWKKDLRRDYDGALMVMAKEMHWGFSESPLLEGKDRLICSPGGKRGTLAALDRLTGDVIWRSTEITDRCSYSSITPVVIDGIRQYLMMTDHHVASILPENGKLLWQFDFPSKLVLCTDPIYCDGIVMATSANKNGAVACRVQKEGTGFAATPVWNQPEVNNTHHGLICLGGYVYSAAKNGMFYCIDIHNGRICWKQRFRSAVSLGCVQGHLLLREEKSGNLTLVEASPEKYTEKGSFIPPQRSDKNAWTYPIVVDNKMFLRDQDTLLQYEIFKQ